MKLCDPENTWESGVWIASFRDWQPYWNSSYAGSASAWNLRFLRSLLMENLKWERSTNKLASWCVMETIATGEGCASISSLWIQGLFHLFWFFCALKYESIKLGLKNLLDQRSIMREMEGQLFQAAWFSILLHQLCNSVVQVSTTKKWAFGVSKFLVPPWNGWRECICASVTRELAWVFRWRLKSGISYKSV